MQILKSMTAYHTAHGDMVGWVWPEQPPPPEVPVLAHGDQGIDVSRWQNSVDWRQVKDAGIDFVFVKASEGTVADQKFTTHWAGAGGVGLLRGAYHYFRQEIDPIAQANTFTGLVSGNELDLAVDVETQNASISTAEFCNRLLTCLRAIEKITGHKPMIYTSKYMWQLLTGNPAWASDYPLWVANYLYSDRPPTLGEVERFTPTLPVGWTTYRCWQYTAVGQVPGISGNVDRDIWN